ncbi:hypothetical protein KM176_13400 [Pseudooceanicola sp. CBS1P-1]|uniref:Uncharacterized protein n=1 Tax=Pseudooceanicola albus TaxID=2692189 RepID=A0A6L7G3X0_9RHOB|nr:MULTISPECIES: hypothetical protein [Pseudooceanicola]MBT9384860.1 hypothetical protein [Pseudooceanicola endophyticus]MXN18146.1 hypothetical protein [Pseudooceanicola albus]
MLTAGDRALTLAPADREAVYVLSADPENPFAGARIRAARDRGEAPRAVAELLGLGVEETADWIELIDPADLTGFGLSGYLVQGLGMDEDDVQRSAEALDALHGPVLLVHGRLVCHAPRALTLPRGLLLRGRFEPPRLPIGLSPLPSPGARGTLPPLGAPLVTDPSRSRLWLPLSILAGLVMAALIAFGAMLAFG